MAVVVQAAFFVEVLTLETQRIIEFAYVEACDFAVGAVVGGPDDIALGGGVSSWGVPRWSSW